MTFASSLAAAVVFVCGLCEGLVPSRCFRGPFCSPPRVGEGGRDVPSPVSRVAGVRPRTRAHSDTSFICDS